MRTPVKMIRTSYNNVQMISLLGMIAFSPFSAYSQNPQNPILYSGFDLYSTQEVLTNKIWINGKMIYRKVIDCGALPDNAQKFVPHGSDVEVITDFRGLMYRGAITTPARWNLPYVANPVSTELIPLDVNNINVVITTYKNWSQYSPGYSAIVVIEYTKP